MAKDYTRISKKGWTCVQGKTGILCQRNKAPLETVTLDDNEVLIVDALRCKTKTTVTGRKHTLCKFKRR